MQAEAHGITLKFADAASNIHNYEEFCKAAYEIIGQYINISWLSLSIINLYPEGAKGKTYTYNAKFDPSFWDYQEKYILNIDFMFAGLTRLSPREAIRSNVLFNPEKDEHVFVQEAVKNKISCAHSMLASIIKTHNEAVFIGVYREIGMKPFSLQEESLLCFNMPLIQAIVERIKTEELALTLKGGINQIAEELNGESLLIDKNLRIQHQTPGWRKFIAPFLGDSDLPEVIKQWVMEITNYHSSIRMPLSVPQTQNIVTETKQLKITLTPINTGNGEVSFLIHAEIPAASLDKGKLKKLGLTIREIKVAEYLPLGITNKQIAESMGISESGVKKHVISIGKKLGASGKVEIVTSLLQNGH